MNRVQDAEPSNTLGGLTVLVTGEIEGHTRHSAHAAIERLGGIPVASVSKKTGLVVIGEGAGVSKMLKVRTLGLRVMDAVAFAALVADPARWDGGEPVEVWDARQNPEEPEPVDTTPMGEQHLVGKAVVRHTARMWCQCGHRWTDLNPFASTSCPKATVS